MSDSGSPLAMSPPLVTGSAAGAFTSVFRDDSPAS